MRVLSSRATTFQPRHNFSSVKQQDLNHQGGDSTVRPKVNTCGLTAGCRAPAVEEELPAVPEAAESPDLLPTLLAQIEQTRTWETEVLELSVQNISLKHMLDNE